MLKKLLLSLLILISMSPMAFSILELNHIEFDPTVVAAGDEVDIIVQFRDTASVIKEVEIGNDDYQFEVRLQADDDLSKEYITFIDSYGDDLKGTILANEVYNKVYRVKVSQDALVGSYQFKLVGKWYKNGELVGGERVLRFEMPVKKEGISINYANLVSNPSQIKAGDNFVELKTSVINVGEKDAKSVEITFDFPEGFEASYSNNNRVFIPRLNAGESYEISLFVNLDKNLSAGVYEVNSNMKYLDLDNNMYEKDLDFSDLLVKPRAYLEIEKFEGSGLAGDSGELKVWIKNVGEESAEAVDVRILKENSQPFTIDVRSDYIGELQPGETGLAIFEFDILSGAEIKEHDLKLQIRSIGDSEKGDDTIYMYNERAKFDVTGQAKNMFIYYGVGLLLLLGLVFVFKKLGGKKSVKKK